ncbi:MAG: LysE family translocator [Planctomycetota bacterium]
MPTWELWTTWLGVNALGIALPGPDLLLVFNRSLSLGVRHGVAAAAGIATGLVCHMVLVGSLLTASAATSGVVLEVIRFAGAGYLIWSGLRMVVEAVRTPAPSLGVDELGDASEFRPGPARLAASYRRGLLVNALNVKAAIWFAALMPQFVEIEGSHVALQVAILGGSAVMLAFFQFSCFSVVAGSLRGVLRRRPAILRWQEAVAGVLFAAIGVTFLFVRLPTPNRAPDPPARVAPDTPD